MKIYNCCCLCLEEDKNNGDNLIWSDGMQLCESCYNHYTQDGDYIKHIMPLNAIKRYRRKIDELQMELEKKDRIMNEMAKDLMQFVKEPVLLPNEIIKEYTRKVENENIN